jgi:hypothetical protein
MLDRLQGHHDQPSAWQPATGGASLIKAGTAAVKSLAVREFLGSMPRSLNSKPSTSDGQPRSFTDRFVPRDDE